MTATPLNTTANERLRARTKDVSAASLIAAVMIHLLVFQLAPPIAVEDWGRDTAPDVTVIDIPDVPLPAPPETIRRPARPVIAANVDATATIEVVPFQNAVQPPPPPAPVRGRTESARPFEVFEVAPRLLNAEDFTAALERSYPPLLRDAGIGGVVALQVYIDAQGRALEARVRRSSGYEALDRTAVQLIDEMIFAPALNRDRRVPVWVEIPIEFRARR